MFVANEIIALITARTGHRLCCWITKSSVTEREPGRRLSITGLCWRLPIRNLRAACLRCVGFPVQRQGDRENRPAIIGILGPRPAALRLHRLAHDAETEPRPFDRRHSLVRAEKAFEQLLAFVWRHSDAVVANADNDLALA